MTVQHRLEHSGLRNTRQRQVIGALLFEDGVDRHVTAEWVADRLAKKSETMALATIYNTLNAFVGAGLLRRIDAAGDTTVFDTNTDPHHHFLDEQNGELIDIDVNSVQIEGLPQVPEGRSVAGVDVIIRLK